MFDNMGFSERIPTYVDGRRGDVRHVLVEKRVRSAMIVFSNWYAVFVYPGYPSPDVATIEVRTYDAGETSSSVIEKSTVDDVEQIFDILDEVRQRESRPAPSNTMLDRYSSFSKFAEARDFVSDKCEECTQKDGCILLKYAKLGGNEFEEAYNRLSEDKKFASLLKSIIAAIGLLALHASKEGITVEQLFDGPFKTIMSILQLIYEHKLTGRDIDIDDIKNSVGDNQ